MKKSEILPLLKTMKPQTVCLKGIVLSNVQNKSGEKSIVSIGIDNSKELLIVTATFTEAEPESDQAFRKLAVIDACLEIMGWLWTTNENTAAMELLAYRVWSTGTVVQRQTQRMTNSEEIYRESAKSPALQGGNKSRTSTTLPN
jgi:hypothetical protein